MNTRTIEVNVTKEHIEKGQAFDREGPRSTTCPVARAILDAVQPLFGSRPIEVGVSTRHVSIRDTYEWRHIASADLPEEVTLRVNQFDQAKGAASTPISAGEGLAAAGEPFSFTLILHSHVVLN